MWFEVRRFNCRPTFIQIILNQDTRTERDFLFFHQSWSSDCYCLAAVIAWRMYYSSRKLYLAVTDCQRPEKQSCLNAFTLTYWCLRTRLYSYNFWCWCKLWKVRYFMSSVICNNDYNKDFLNSWPLTSATFIFHLNTLQYRKALRPSMEKSQRILFLWENVLLTPRCICLIPVLVHVGLQEGGTLDKMIWRNRQFYCETRWKEVHSPEDMMDSVPISGLYME